MSYLNTIKIMYEHIKNNNEISEEEKEKAKKLLDELSRLLAFY